MTVPSSGDVADVPFSATFIWTEIYNTDTAQPEQQDVMWRRNILGGLLSKNFSEAFSEGTEQ